MEPLLHEVDGVENRIELSVIIIREYLIWVVILIRQDLNNHSDLTPRRFICIILLRIIAYGPPFNWSVRGILRRKGAFITLVESKISFFGLKLASLLWHYVYLGVIRDYYQISWDAVRLSSYETRKELINDAATICYKADKGWHEMQKSNQKIGRLKESPLQLTRMRPWEYTCECVGTW
jgi:hypothetical protein